MQILIASRDRRNCRTSDSSSDTIRLSTHVVPFAATWLSAAPHGPDYGEATSMLPPRVRQRRRRQDTWRPPDCQPATGRATRKYRAASGVRCPRPPPFTPGTGLREQHLAAAHVRPAMSRVARSSSRGTVGSPRRSASCCIFPGMNGNSSDAERGHAACQRGQGDVQFCGLRRVLCLRPGRPLVHVLVGGAGQLHRRGHALVQQLRVHGAAVADQARRRPRPAPSGRRRHDAAAVPLDHGDRAIGQVAEVVGQLGDV
jgi:hypothetical protein